jgi:hypothetical protein
MDARIALGLDPLVLPDPSEPLHKALAIQSLMGQRDMQDLQLQQGRHDYQKQLAIDRALQGATSDDDVYDRLRGIDPKMAIGLRQAQFKADKDKYDSLQTGVELASRAASSFLALPPDQQAIKYPQLVQQFNQYGFKGGLEPWDAQKLLPGIQWIAAKGLSPEKGIDRMDLSGNGTIRQPTVPQSTSPAANALMPGPESMFSRDLTKGLEQTSGAVPIVKDMQGSVGAALQAAQQDQNQQTDRWGVPFSEAPETQVGFKAPGSIPNPVRPPMPVPVPGSPAAAALGAGQQPQSVNTGFNGNLVPVQASSPAATALGAGQPTQTAPVEVTGTPSGPRTPDSLRAEANSLRATRRPANIALANQLEEAANKLDSRLMEQQKLDQTKYAQTPDVAGAYFDPKAGTYMMNGKEVSAATLQAIQLANNKAKAAQQTVNAYEKELNKKDAEVVSAGRLTAEHMTDNAAQIGLIRDLLKGYQGGPWSQIQATMGNYLPGTEFAKATSADQVARSIQVKLATQTRAVGSGSTSDYEMKMYLESIPSLMTTEKGRDMMVTIADRLADRAAAAADIKDQLVRAEKYSVTGYRDALKKQFGDKFLTPEEIKVINPTAANASKGVGSGTRTDPIRIKGDDGFDALKPGQYYMGPDGETRLKR